MIFQLPGIESIRALPNQFRYHSLRKKKITNSNNFINFILLLNPLKATDQTKATKLLLQNS
jgi:hypothetical protein